MSASFTHALPASQPPRDLLALRDVLREDARVEPVAAVVGEPHGLVGVAHLHDRQRRAEGLLGHDLHRVVDAGEHGRLEELARARARPCRRPAPRRPCRPRPGRGLRTISICGGNVIAPTSTWPGSPGRALAQLARLRDDLLRRTRRRPAPRRRRARPRCRSGRCCDIAHCTAMFAARSTSASRSTIIGSLPPSSSEHRDQPLGRRDRDLPARSRSSR